MSADGSYSFSATPSPDELARYPLNDFGNAQRLIRMVGGSIGEDGEVDASQCRLLYLRDHGWIGFNGKFWDLRGGEALARRWGHKVAAGLFAQGKDAVETHGLTTAKWYQWLSSVGNAGSTTAMLKQAEAYLAADLKDFDFDPLALNVENGVIRFRLSKDGKPKVVFEGRHDPADRMTRICDAAYDPKAAAPAFDRLVAFSLPKPDRRAYFSSVFGYGATGSVKEQIFVVLQGKGGDGKSTIVNAIRETMGTYGICVGIETFLDSGPKRGGEASPDVARLAGDTRLISTGEAPRGAKLSTGAIKSFTGGSPIVARNLREGIFEFAPVGKVILECNQRPVINDTDDGIWRRTRIILFEHQVAEADKDKDLPEKLRAERPGILNWLIAGVLAWMKDGLVTPDDVLEALQDYRRGASPFGEWFADRVIPDRDAKVLSKDLYADYKRWMEAEGHDKPISTTAFGRALGDLQVISAGKDGAGRKQRRGARLRPWPAAPAADDPFAPPSSPGGTLRFAPDAEPDPYDGDD